QPVLVFDQFEELFTLGHASKETRFQSNMFLEELADLVENRVPAVLAQRFEDDPDLAEQFDFDRQNYRVLLCLREDYLPHLEDLRKRMPAIGHNRMRLTRMNDRQAFEAVSKPGGDLVTPDVCWQIVRFVAASRSSEAPAGNGQQADNDS